MQQEVKGREINRPLNDEPISDDVDSLIEISSEVMLVPSISRSGEVLSDII